MIIIIIFMCNWRQKVCQGLDVSVRRRKATTDSVPAGRGGMARETLEETSGVGEEEAVLTMRS